MVQVTSYMMAKTNFALKRGTDHHRIIEYQFESDLKNHSGPVFLVKSTM